MRPRKGCSRALHARRIIAIGVYSSSPSLNEHKRRPHGKTLLGLVEVAFTLAGSKQSEQQQEGDSRRWTCLTPSFWVNRIFARRSRWEIVLTQDRASDRLARPLWSVYGRRVVFCKGSAVALL